MISVNTKQAKADILKAFSGFNKDEIQKLTNRSINRALGTARTESSKLIREIYKIPKSEVDKGFFIRKAYSSDVTGYLKASAQTTQMGQFPVTEIRENVMTRKVGTIKTKAGKKTVYGSARTRLKTTGVMVEIFKGKKKLIKSAFLSLKVKGGASVRGYGTYGSKGFNFDNSITKSSRLKTVSPFSAFHNLKISDEVSKKTQDMFSKRMLHELEFAIKSR